MLRYAIAGCGYISKTHFRALAQIPEARIVAAADLHADLLQKRAQEFAVPQTFGTLEAMLDGAGFDVLVLLTPTHLHVDHAALAARSGAAVLLEKPLAPTVAESRQIIETFRAAGVRLGVLHSSRYFAHCLQAKRLFADGTLGRPLAVDFEAHLAVERPERYDPRFWRHNPGARGHGICINTFSHWADMVRYLTATEAVRVRAEVQNLFSAGIIPEDQAAATIFFQGGTVLTWRYMTGESGLPAEQTITYYGSRGRLVTHDIWGGTSELILGSERRTLPCEPPQSPHNWITMHREFLQAIETGADLPITPEDGLAAVKISEAVYESATTGRTVEL
jgi:UDP-N-acetyl-2-amino-2-deoxyglucuronate dehydrogenase